MVAAKQGTGRVPNLQQGILLDVHRVCADVCDEAVPCSSSQAVRKHSLVIRVLLPQMTHCALYVLR